MVRELPAPAIVPEIDIEESVASLEDEILVPPRVTPPPPKSRLSLRDDRITDLAAAPAALPVPSPDPEKYEEESRKARLLEAEVGPVKERLVQLATAEEKRALSPAERGEMVALLAQY